MAFFGVGVPVRSLGAALFAVEGFGIPEGRFRRTHSDLPSRAVSITLACYGVEDFVGFALNLLLARVRYTVVYLILRAFKVVLLAGLSWG